MPLEVLMAGKAGLTDLALKRLIALRIRAGDSNRHLQRDYWGGSRPCRLVSLQSMSRDGESILPIATLIALSGPVPTLRISVVHVASAIYKLGFTSPAFLALVA